jgi:hypothetical protein
MDAHQRIDWWERHRRQRLAPCKCFVSCHFHSHTGNKFRAMTYTGAMIGLVRDELVLGGEEDAVIGAEGLRRRPAGR